MLLDLVLLLCILCSSTDEFFLLSLLLRLLFLHDNVGLGTAVLLFLLFFFLSKCLSIFSKSILSLEVTSLQQRRLELI